MIIANYSKNQFTYSTEDGSKKIIKINQTGFVFWSFDLLMGDELVATAKRKIFSLGYVYRYVSKNGAIFDIKYSSCNGLTCIVNGKEKLRYKREGEKINIFCNDIVIFSGEYIDRNTSTVNAMFKDESFINESVCLLHLGELHKRHFYS